MSFHPSSTPTGSSGGELKYTLRVRRAELIEALKKSVLYVEIVLPKGLQVLTQTVESSKLEWNRRFNFTSRRAASIQVKLKTQGLFQSDCLGEASIGVGDLIDHCRAGQDYSLVLLSPKRRHTIGTVLLQLEIKADLLRASRLSSDLGGSRQMVENMRSKIVKTLSVRYPDGPLSPTASKHAASVTGRSEELDGFEILTRVRSRLDSMKSGKLKMALGMIDAAAKIHPCVESSWEIVSSLHSVYQKKAKMDLGVIEAFVSMDSVLSYVEDVDRLKSKGQRFFNLIEESLRVIEHCGTFILNYIKSNTKDRTRSALSNEERLSYYQGQLQGLAENLDRTVNVHVAQRLEDNHEVLTHRLEDNHNEVMEVLERIDGKPNNFQPSSTASFQSIIPPPPTDMFTGRDDYLKSMEDSFELPKTSIEIRTQRRFVLYGTGGMGKTQLALKFVDENQERFTTQYIIDASSHESIAASFVNIGRDAGIPDADTHKTLNWLSKKVEDWILIFDNADNRDVKLQPYFPRCRHGNILITTRNADYESLAPSLEVSVLEESSAVTLLLRTAQLKETQENWELAWKIVTEFGHLALAIVQAGSYVRAERLNLEEYYRRYERSRRSLLQSGPLKEELAYGQPVYATWEISYVALSGFAKTMLDLCSFLYREGITEDLWSRAVGSEKTRRALRNEQDDPIAPKELLSLLRYLYEDEDSLNVVRFREIIRELRSYSLIQEPFRGSFSIHPLVHSWSRERMESEQQLGAQANAVYLLYYSLPLLSEQCKNIYFSRTILPHLEACGHPLHANIALEFAGTYAVCYRQDDSRTQKLLEVALTEGRYEVDDQNTYDSRRRLAEVYFYLRRYSEAAEIFQTLIDEQKRVMGNNHSLTLANMHDLASTYRDEGRLDDAQELLTQVTEARKQVLGNVDSSTLDSIHDLACTHQDQGRFNEAQELFTQVLEARTRVLGNEHPSTLDSMHRLASTYSDQGRLNDAHELFTQVIEAMKRTLGVDHAETLISMHWLAATCQDLGRLDDAQQLFTQVIEGRKRVLGNDHPSTLNSIHQLACAYQDQGRLDDAQKLFSEVFEGRKRVLGNDHSSTLDSMHQLACAYQDQGQLDDAQKLFTQVIEERKRVLGNDHFSTLNSMHQSACAHHDQGRFNDAQELFTHVVEARKRVLGINNLLTLNSMDWLAHTYHDREQQQLDDAKEVFVEVVEAKKLVLGSDNPSTLGSMHYLALTYLEQSRLAEAEELCVEVYERRHRAFGLANEDTLSARDLLITIYSQQGRLGDAGRLEALTSNNPRSDS